MNRLLFAKIIVIFLSVAFAGVASAQLATYAGSGGTSTLVTGVPNETVTSLLYSGFGSNTPCGSGGLSGITVNTIWSSYSISGPRVYVKITPNPGYQLNMTGMNAGMRRSGTGPTCVRFAYSLDNGVTWTDDGACHAPINSGCGSTAVSSWSGGPLPTGITSTTNGIIVALFPYLPGGSTGTFQVNTLNVLGNVTVSCSPPGPIAGATPICVGYSAVFSNATPGGAWSSSATSIATVSVGGLVSGVSAGSATITYSMGPGCISTFPVTINPLPAPISGVPTVCVGLTTALTDAGGGAWTSFNTSVATIGVSTGLVSGVGAGTASISYALSTGCRTGIVVTVNPLPSMISGATNVCVGDIVALSSSPIGGTWSSSNTNVSIGISSGLVSGNVAGTSVITYTLSTGCYITATMSVDPLPAVITGPGVVCVGAAITLSNASVGGAWGTASTNISLGAGSGVVLGLSPGTATVSYSLSTGCAVFATVTVNPVPPIISGSTNVCVGSIVPLSNTMGGGTWSSSNSSIASVGIFSGMMAGVSGGTAVITYTSGSGCITTTTVNINSLPPAISGVKSVCAGFQTTLSAGGGGVWTSGNTTVATIDPSTGIVSGMIAGTSAITFTIGSGCTSTAIVTVNPLPATISGNTNVCPASVTTLSDAGGGTWTSDNTTIAIAALTTGAVSGVAPGTTTITYTLSTGCYTTTALTVNPLPAVITGPGNVCAGLTIVLSDATVPGVWSSTNTAVATIDPSTGVLAGGIAGTSVIVYTISTGCRTFRTVTIDPLPSPISGTSSVCQRLTTSLSDAGGGTWASANTAIATIGAISGLVTGVSAGTSSVTYTLSTGCIGTTVVTVNPLPAAISGPATVCQGSMILLSNATPGGFWGSSNTLVATAGPGAGTVTGIASGTATISYTLFATGCVNTASVLVHPVVPISGVPYLCVGSSAILSDPLTGGTWASSNIPVATIGITSGLLSGSSVGTSIISYTFTSGCITMKQVTVNPFPSSISGSPTVCQGAMGGLSDVPAGGVWSSGNPGVAAIDAYTGALWGVAAGTADITYSNGPGCTVSRNVTVNVAVSPITGVHNMCAGGSNMTVYNADAPSGAWTSTSATVSSGGVLTAYTVGPAIVSYTLPTGCFDTAMFMVDPLPGKISGPSVACTGSSIMLSDSTSGGAWYSSDPTVSVVTGSVLAISAGTATISYTLPTGCMTADTITIFTQPDPIAGNADMCIGATTVFSDAVPGGVWSGSAPFVASIDPVTGAISGLSSGLSIISYTTGSVCSSMLTATVLPSPVLYSVSGGGSICAGDAGLSIKLSGSGTGISYRLLNGGMPVDSMPGSGTALLYGPYTTSGSYSVVAVNTSTTCTRKMPGSASIVVDPILVPSVNAGLAPTDTVCAGTSVFFVPLSVNGGSSPSYEWLVNGISAGTGSTYSYKPANGDVVVVVLKSNATCARPSVAYDSRVLSVVTASVPDVVIVADPGNSIEKGQPVMFTANVSNAGGEPTYQWYKNGNVLTGATGATYVANDLSNYDSLSCKVTAGDICGLSSVAHIYMNVTTTGVSGPLNSGTWSVFPNPGEGNITVTGITTPGETVHMEVSNVLGQIVYSHELLSADWKVNTSLRLSDLLNEGIYLLHIQTSSGERTFRLVIAR